MMKSKFRFAMSAVLFALVCTGPATAQTPPKVLDTGIAEPLSAIFIGNSYFYYNNGINAHLIRLIRAANPSSKFRTTMVTISGSGTDWHDVGSYFRPDAIGRYSFDGKNNIVFNKIDRLFDVAIMMDCSQCPVHPQLKSVFVDYSKKHIETVRKAGTVPVLFMSWAYSDKPEMTGQLAEVYTRVGNDNDVLVIPAGLAFAKAVKEMPEVNLYAPDKRHPSLAGTYLAAATVYATILKRSPEDAGYTAGLEANVAKALRMVAWETVQSYFGTAVSSR